VTTVASPHDRLFRSAMADLRVAREFFQRHLPTSILPVVDWSVLKLCSQTYVDNALKLSQSDILYQTHIAYKEAYLYLLCEHQSTPDVMMPFRLLQYCIGIWNDVLKQSGKKIEKLPLIVAMVFYNGKEPYIYSMDFKDLLDAPREMIEAIWGKPFQLVDVSQIPDEELKQHKWSGIMEFFMKHTMARDFLPYLKQAAHHLCILERENGADYVVSLLNYALKSTQMTDLKTFTDTVKNHLTLPTGEKIMTLAEQLIERGMEQGMLQGEHQLLVRQLRRKFLTIDNKYLSLIKNAEEEKLLTWGERLVEASTLKEIFGC